MRLLLAAVTLSLLALRAGASDFGRPAVGTTGSEFLLFDTSARGVAMGGAYSAVANDASSIYWNPAGLAQVPRFSATFLHSQYIADITYSAAATAFRINDASVIAFGARYLDGGVVPRTDINGLETGSFHPRSYVAELGWGQTLYDLSDSEMDVAMGVNAKYLYTDIVAHAEAVAADFGLQSRFYGASRTYDAAFVVQNLGRGQRFDQTRDSLPTRVRASGGVRPIKPLLLTLEAVAPINDAVYGAAGAEYTIEVDKRLKGAVRAGFNSLTYESLGVASMLNFGFGVTMGDLTVDYAFVPMGVLGSGTHRISVSFNLPAKVSRRYRER